MDISQGGALMLCHGEFADDAQVVLGVAAGDGRGFLEFPGVCRRTEQTWQGTLAHIEFHRLAPGHRLQLLRLIDELQDGYDQYQHRIAGLDYGRERRRRSA
jgi:hypothetical protein